MFFLKSLAFSMIQWMLAVQSMVSQPFLKPSQFEQNLGIKSLQSCPTLCDPMDCSLENSSVHGIFQARILEWVFLSPGHHPDPGIELKSPALQADSLLSEPPDKPLICTVHHAKCQAGWFTSWNQDCSEKYQQPQICRWYNSNGRKQRGTKEHLDEGERGEWKSWLKTSFL